MKQVIPRIPTSQVRHCDAVTRLLSGRGWVRIPILVVCSEALPSAAVHMCWFGSLCAVASISVRRDASQAWVHCGAVYISIENAVIATKLHPKKRVPAFSVTSRENSRSLPLCQTQIGVFNLCQPVRKKMVSDFVFMKGCIKHNWHTMKDTCLESVVCLF